MEELTGDTNKIDQAKADSKKAYEVHQLFQSFRTTHRDKWQKSHQECYDFYLNDQLDKKTLQDLREAGMPDFVINMIIPSVELMKYFLTANNPRWQTIGREGSDAAQAAVYAGIHEYIFHNSDGKAELGQGIIDCINKSKLYWHVVIDPDADQGQGEVISRTENPFNVFESPTGKNIYGKDAGAKLIHKNMTRQQLIIEFPQFEKQIKKACSTSTTYQFTERDINLSPSIQPEDIQWGFDNITGEISDMMDYIEKYRKIKVPYLRIVTAIPPSQEDIDEINEYINMSVKEMELEAQVEMKELETNLDKQVDEGAIIPERRDYELRKAEQKYISGIEEQKAYLYSKAKDEATKVEVNNIRKSEYDKYIKGKKDIEEFIVSKTEYYETRIERSCVVGNQLLYEYILPDPISEYPLFSIPAIFTGTPYPMSFTLPAIGKQKEINRAHQIMIHNANLGSNLRVLAQEGQIDDDLWDKYMASPGARLYWRNLGDGTKPEFIQPMPLNAAFFDILAKGQSDFEYLMGMQGSAMGIVDQQADTYRGMLAADEYSTRRLRGWLINIFEPGMDHLGQVVDQFAKAYYTEHKIFRIVQPNAGTGDIQSSEIEVNLPIYDNLGVEIGRYNDLRVAQYDIVYVAGSTMPVNRWALLEEYFRWFQADIIDDVEFIRHTDIQDKEGLAERKSMYAQLKNEILSLEDAIKKRDGDIETLSRQVLLLAIRAKEMGAITEMRKDVLDNEAKQKELVSDLEATIKVEKEKLKQITKEAAKNEKKVDNSSK